MNKFILSVLMLISITSFSQTVNGIPLKDINVDYVQIVGTTNLMRTKVSVDIDFGQKQNIWTGEDTKLLDADGTPVKLNSMIDALNFMCKSGYEFVTAYAITVGNQNVYHYLLRKKK